MAKTKKSSKKTNSSPTSSINSSTLYYVIRIAQRFSLLALGLLAVAYTALLFSMPTVAILSLRVDNYGDSATQLLDGALSFFRMDALVVAIIAAGLTWILCMMPRVRNYEKRLVVDSAVIIVFCLMVVYWGEALLRYFYAHSA